MVKFIKIFIRSTSIYGKNISFYGRNCSIMEKVINKIREIRHAKRFSHEYMAQMLALSPSAYTKLERMDTKLTVERLMKISEVLETPIQDLLEIAPDKVYHQNIAENGIGYQDIQTLYAENQETIEKLIAAKDELIQKMEKQLEFLRGIIKNP